MDAEKKFKGIYIPYSIWDHPKLSLQDKLVWALMENEGRENFDIEKAAEKFKTTPEKILNSVDTIFEHRLVKVVRYV